MTDVPAANIPPPPTLRSAEDMCQYARERYREIARWRSVWTVLLFLVGCAIVVFVILSIISFRDQKVIEVAAGAIGTLISGAAMTWVVTRRNEAVKEEDDAWKGVEQHCGKTDATAHAIRAKTQFLRFTKGR
jgi:hypothetical protein